MERWEGTTENRDRKQGGNNGKNKPGGRERLVEKKGTTQMPTTEGAQGGDESFETGGGHSP